MNAQTAKWLIGNPWALKAFVDKELQRKYKSHNSATWDNVHETRVQDFNVTVFDYRRRPPEARKNLAFAVKGAVSHIVVDESVNIAICQAAGYTIYDGTKRLC